MLERTTIVVTGASGWFGRTALYEYEKLYGPEALRSNVIACASTPRPIDFCSPYGPLNAVGIDDLESVRNAAGLIHLAFLTRERVASVGLDQYIAENRSITARVAVFIANNPGIPIITTSSGAAGVFDGADVDLIGNPYASLKREEENVWRQSSFGRMALVFRVYAATGRFIKDPKLFALGDFLSSAVVGERIVVRSDRTVIRSYVHVGTMMRLFWAILKAPVGPGFRQIDAAMQTASLCDLAKEISEIWALPEPIINIDTSLPADIYRADGDQFRNLLKEYEIEAPAFATQLEETAQQLKDV